MRRFREVFPHKNTTHPTRDPSDTEDSSHSLNPKTKIMSKKMGKRRESQPFEQPLLQTSETPTFETRQVPPPFSKPKKRGAVPFREGNRLCLMFEFLPEVEKEKVLKECELASLELVTVLRMRKGELGKFKKALAKELRKYGRTLEDDWGEEAESSFEIEEES